MTFKTLDTDFEERVKEVDLFFTVLTAVENGDLAVIPTAGSPLLPAGSPPGDWGRMLKGATYLVLYNLVEAFVRRGFQEVFDAIKHDNLSGSELNANIIRQWILQKNRRVSTYDGSPKVYMEIANEVVNEIVSKKAVELHKGRLPFSGNLNADEIRDVCDQHGIDTKTDPLAKGGVALEQVVKKRNSLSHGNESFSECGRDLTVQQLMQSKEEVVTFMRSILKNIATFAKTKSYKAIP